MRKVGRTLLGLGRTVNNEVIQGELGWWRMGARRDFIRLKYWGRILNMAKDRLPRRVYEISKNLTENIRGSWINVTKTLLLNLNLAVTWQQQEIGDMGEWVVLINSA